MAARAAVDYSCPEIMLKQPCDSDQSVNNTKRKRRDSTDLQSLEQTSIRIQRQEGRPHHLVVGARRCRKNVAESDATA